MRFGLGLRRGNVPPQLLALVLVVIVALGTVACEDSEDSNNSSGSQTPGPAIGTGDPVADLAMGTATVAAGGTVTVDLVATLEEGTTIGALDLDVSYDPSVVKAESCTPAGCNVAFATDTVRFSMANLSGFSGVIGGITFSAVGGDGSSSPLSIEVESCANVEAEIIPCSATAGSVSVGP
jgi:hypothetical protein